jgi:hypothetical protein
LTILLLVVSSNCNTSRAADYTKVGVKQGDTATYQEHSVLDVVEHTATSSTGTYTVYVEKVKGSLVTLDEYYYGSREISMNVSNGGAGLGLAGEFLCPAGLSQGDPLYLNSYAPIISQTMQTIVVGQNRTVNFVNETVSGSSYLNYVWRWYDKSTGLLVKIEACNSSSNFSPDLNETLVVISELDLTLMSTTAFGGSADIALYVAIGGGLAAAVIAGVAVATRRRGK